MALVSFVLRRSLAAAPRAASLGAGLGRPTKEPPSQFPTRLFGSGAPGSGGNTFETIQDNVPRSEVASDPGVNRKRLCEEKRKELIDLLAEAVDTCEPAHRDRVLKKQEELKHVLREYRAEGINGQKTLNTDNGGTTSKTAGGEKPLSFGDYVTIAVAGSLLGLIGRVLDNKLRG
ncbi:hypothetical protein ACP70R_033977 [Stipagrostis hirtigluma subsp. patula]